MSHKLYSTTKALKSPKSMMVEHVISFPNYVTWIYFDTGDFQTWNLQDEKLVKTGEIEADATLKFHFFSASQIAYYSKKNKKVEVLDIVSGEFGSGWQSCKIPTEAALSEADKNDEEKIENLQCFTELSILPDSGTIVVMEPKPMNQTFNEHVITSFTVAGKGS